MTSPKTPPEKESDLIESPRLLIRASAGTGKTFQLSSRYISLLRFAAPERILSSTFTRKAAGEILERILLRLARAAFSAKSLKELAGSVGAPGLSREACLGMLAQLTRQLHRVRISTLDAFFSQLAGSHALELGLPSGWRILDTMEVQQLRAQALEQMLREGDQQELVQLMHMLDKGDSSRSVSGLMHQTINDLYEVFVDSSPESWNRFPDHQFLSEATREELLEKLALVPIDQKRMQTAVTNDSAAIREERWDDFLKKGLLPKIRSTDRTYYKTPIPEALFESYLQLAEHCLAVTSAAWKQQTLAAWRLLNDFQTIFEKLKQAAGGLEFGDITRRLARSQQGENRPDITFRMDGAIEHLLLDEFQDTSRPQWEAIRGFAEEACHHPERSFFCVGDVKQAIYGWRGGEAAIFDAIEQQLPGLTAQPLNLSYRSSPVVIDTVNRAMTRLHQHNNLEEHADLLHRWCRDFPQHETKRTDLTGYACLRTGPEAPETDDGPATSHEQRNEFWKFSSNYVAELARQSPQSSIGILMRGNAAVGRMIFELSRLGIEASEEGGNPLTDSAGVQLVLSLLRLADHPGDTISAYHVMNSPLGKVLNDPQTDDPSVLANQALELRERLLQQGYGRVIHDLALRLADVCNRREHRRLLQLATLGDQFDALLPSLRPGEFVNFAESQRCAEPSNARIRVMTIHQSKGLEFDLVVLPDLGNQLMLPPRYVTHTPTPGTPPDLVALYRSEEYFTSLGGDLLAARQETRNRMVQEALCLLYVALTRAARSLHMLISPKVSAKHPKTFSGLLRAALAPDVALAPDKLLWAWGDPDWSKSTASPPAVAPVTSSVPPLRFASRTAPRRWKTTAPTQKKTPQKIRILDSFHKAGKEDALSGAERGTLFHEWLSRIVWLEETLPSDAELKRLTRQFSLSEGAFQQHLQQFKEMLQRPGISALCSLSGYAGRRQELAAQHGRKLAEITMEVRTELSFVQQIGPGELMNGSIDRLVLFHVDGQPVAAEVIDFKTDNAASAENQKRLTDLYRGQLEAYRNSTVTLWGLEASTVSTKLAFLQNDLIVEIV